MPITGILKMLPAVALTALGEKGSHEPGRTTDCISPRSVRDPDDSPEIARVPDTVTDCNERLSPSLQSEKRGRAVEK